MKTRSNLASCLSALVLTSTPVAAGCVLGISLVLGTAVTAISQEARWIGGGGDNLWSNPDNWESGELPTFGDEVRINGPQAEAPNGPLIEDGIEAEAGVLIADNGISTMTMTGGHLELAGWGSWWADAVGSTATFNMSGGVVDFTGGPGVMELGWQESGSDPGGSSGTWTMSGGVVNAKGVDMPGKGYGGTAVINLWGGTLNVGTERGGLMMYEGALIDITDGQLVLESDQVPLIEDYIDSGWITAHGGKGELAIDFDGEYTTVSAVATLRLEAGDADEDMDFDQLDLVQVQVAAKYLTGQAATWGDGDWNGAPGGQPGSPPQGDGLFNQLDIIAALASGNYLAGPYGASKPRLDEAFLLDAPSAGAGLGLSGAAGQANLVYVPVPEPASALLLALGAAALLAIGCRRRCATGCPG